VEAEGDVLAYLRRAPNDGSVFLIALNLGSTPQILRRAAAEGAIEISTWLDRVGEPVQENLYLRADEGVVVRLGAAAA
jgi:hypothetical protein